MSHAGAFTCGLPQVASTAICTFAGNTAASVATAGDTANALRSWECHQQPGRELGHTRDRHGFGTPWKPARDDPAKRSGYHEVQHAHGQHCRRQPEPPAIVGGIDLGIPEAVRERCDGFHRQIPSRVGASVQKQDDPRCEGTTHTEHWRTGRLPGMRIDSTAGARRLHNRQRTVGRVGFPDAARILVVALLSTACAGTSSQQVASEAKTTTTAETTRSTTTPPDCAATLPTTAVASQLLMVMVNDPSQAADDLSGGLVGGFGLKGEQRSDVDEAIRVATSDLPLPATVAVDEEGGPVQRLRYSAGRLPSAQEMSEMSITEVTSIITEHATRMAEVGATMNFAPVADLRNDEILEGRTYSEDPDTVAKYAVAVAAANSGAGITPVVKHWPGIGGSNTDPHESLPVLASIEELRAQDLRSFEPLIDGEPVAVMVAHAEIPGLTDQGEPASLSRRAISGELRDTEGFDGLVITDSLGMGAIVSEMTQAEAAERAIAAGADIALVSGADVVADAHSQLVGAIEEGRIPSDQVEESVRRVLAMKGIEGECFDAISAYGAIERTKAEASATTGPDSGAQAGQDDQSGPTGELPDSGINDPG